MKEINDVAEETLEVLRYFDNEFVSKIPRNVIKKLEELFPNHKCEINY